MSLFKAIATVGGLTLISRVFGFIRDILIAVMLGAGPLADAFIVAFRLPNLFRRLFAEGAFNAAFVPIFAGRLEQSGKQEAQAFAEQALAVLLWALLVVVLLFEIFMPYAIFAISAGFADTNEKLELVILLTRITFPYLLFISLVSLMAGVLNSMQRFAAAAATPILLNLTLISGLIWFTQLFETPAHVLAWAVAAAGIIQFLWLLYHCGRSGMWLRLPLPRLTPDVRTMLRRILPGAVGAGVYQINLLIDTNFASFLQDGSITYLYVADRVTQLPLGVVGVAVGTALLPILSRQLKSKDPGAAQDSQNRALEITLLLTLPAAVALLIIPMPIIAALFQYQSFTLDSAVATAGALGAYAVGLPAYVLIRTITPGYFAREDTVTPVKVAAIALLVNLVLNIVLIGPLQHVGLALATSISAWINFALLAWLLHRRGHFALDLRFKQRLPRILSASLGMGLVLYGLDFVLAGLMADGTTGRITAMVMLVIGGLISYCALALLFGCATRAELRRVFSRRRD